LIQREGGLSRAEMDRTFNNGLGVIVVIAKRDIDRLERSLKRLGEPFFLIGEIRGGERKVRFVS
jgi:phosphoribosylaminoimidazole (AIR) synthetase